MKNEKFFEMNGVKVGVVNQTYDIITRFYAPRELVEYVGDGNAYGFSAKFSVDVNTGRGIIRAGTPMKFHHTRVLGEGSNLLIVQ